MSTSEPLNLKIKTALICFDKNNFHLDDSITHLGNILFRENIQIGRIIDHLDLEPIPSFADTVTKYDLIVIIDKNYNQLFSPISYVINSSLTYNESLKYSIPVGSTLTKNPDTNEIVIIECGKFLVLPDCGNLHKLKATTKFFKTVNNEINDQLLYHRHLYFSHDPSRIPNGPEVIGNKLLTEFTNKVLKDVNVIVTETNDSLIHLVITSQKLENSIINENRLRKICESHLKLSGSIRCNVTLVYSKSESWPSLRESIQILESCFTKYSLAEIFLCFNGGKDCTVLLHLTLAVLRAQHLQVPGTLGLKLVYIRSECEPYEEVEKFVRETAADYEMEMLTVDGDIKTGLAQILQQNPKIRAALMGTRRIDPYSGSLENFQMTDPSWPQVMRVNPILEWSYQDIWRYLLTFNVPYCHLYDQGFTSLGGRQNTSPNNDLRTSDGSYLPAYLLTDESKERDGRN